MPKIQNGFLLLLCRVRGRGYQGICFDITVSWLPNTEFVNLQHNQTVHFMFFPTSFHTFVVHFTNLQHKFSTVCKISSVLVDLGFLYLSWYFPFLHTIHTCTPFIFSCLYGTLIWPPNTGVIRSSKVCLICTLTNE